MLGYLVSMMRYEKCVCHSSNMRDCMKISASYDSCNNTSEDTGLLNSFEISTCQWLFMICDWNKYVLLLLTNV